MSADKGYIQVISLPLNQRGKLIIPMTGANFLKTFFAALGFICGNITKIVGGGKNEYNANNLKLIEWSTCKYFETER